MSFDQDIADIQARIAKAEADRDHWRIVGRQEKYMESYFLVDALELELDRARVQGIERASRAAEDHSPPAAPEPAVVESPAAERARQMTEYSITPSGRQYQYSHYRYDRFEDALGYARKQSAAPSAGDASDSLPPARLDAEPDEEQCRQMAAHGITFDEGVYHLGPYRYDRLADAIGYARKQGLGAGIA